MTNGNTRFGAHSALILIGLLSASGVARGEDGAAPPAKPECSFPCFFHSADAAPAPQAASDPTPPAPAAASAPAAKPAPKVVHPLTIAADEAEIGRLKGLTSVLPGQPIKIVKTPPETADFAVKTALQPASDSTVYRDAKLFTEQLHIIAGGKITRVEDLRDHVVSFGADGSPGQDAARKAFQALGVSVKETPLDLDNALDGASTGDIDAVVVLAPQPFERLKTMSRSGLHLLAWPDNASLPAGAVDATIAADAYPGLAKPGETLRAVGVDAVLSVSARGAKQPATKRFMSALAQHSAALSKHGFDLLKADLDARTGSRMASADRR
ncbi:hypothetical protein [Beijerinckia sp. L45]|uniref:hypothetical protein n=1 Tax=Beijerinckia sp. L45 TaxID=1641855 RepID=UPI001AEEBFC9|nr:hypothetical protein [Beijerinckia sp. L45]